MSRQVTVLPDRTVFSVEGNESILDAALRAGMSLDYGCANGNCGQCRARKLKGQVRRIRPSDYVLSETEKAQDYLLLCAHTAEADVVIEAHPAKVAADIPEQCIQTRVREIEHVNEDVAVLKLRTPRSQRLRFLAGQYAELRAADLPAYESTIASCPCDGLNIEFHVRRMPGEPFSQVIFNRLRTGDAVELRAPRGSFAFDDAFHGPLLFVAFDTGFAAIKSLLEHATALDEDRVIHLYWLACDRQGHYLDNLCRSWSDAFDQFSYRPLSLKDDYARLMHAPVASLDLVNFLFDDIVREISAATWQGQPLTSAAAAYVSAPEPLLEPARAALSQVGFDAARLRLEPVRGNRNAACLLKTL